MTTTRRRSRLRDMLVAALMSVGLVAGPAAYAAQVGTVPEATAAAQLEKGMNPQTQTPATAKTRLPTLAVKPAGSMEGYSRSLFPHWRDASTWGWPVEPNNACNVRNAALYRDGVVTSMSTTCTSLKGTWVDPYSARKFDSASDIDIDHIVPLANAYRSGAKEWTTTKRTQFANDPLVAVSSWDYLNQQKGDKGPESWKPQNTVAHCLYATRWVHTKDKYTLSITSAEKAALTSMLNTC